MRSQRDGLCASTVAWIAMAAFAFPFSCAAGEAEEDVTDAGEVLEKHIEAMGGREAHEALKTRVSKTRLEFKTMGFTADVTHFQARPSKSLVRMVGDKVGTFTEGVLDGVAWELSSTGGPRLKVAAERAGALRDAEMDGILRWRDIFDSVEHAGSAVIDGRPCHKIVLTPKQGLPEARYFDRQSFVLVKRECVIDHPMGLLQAELYFDDYRRVDGVLIPFQMRTVLAGDERLHTTLSVKHNMDFPDDLFALPNEIKALLDQGDGKDSGAGRKEGASP